MSPTPRPRQNLANVIRRYRVMTGLSQNEFSALSFQLAEEGVIAGGIMQQHLSRLENGTAPMPGTLHTLSLVLAHAMRDAGFEEVQAEELHRHLLNANRSFVGSREVSREAAELDAILAPLAGSKTLEIIWAGIHGFAEAAIQSAHTIARRIRHNDSQR